jgi:hypothetical protein
MKKILIPGIILSLLFSISAFTQKTKEDQSNLYNDVNISYGIGSFYLFTSEIKHSYDNYSSYGKRSDIKSAGTIMIGYNRMISDAFMIGFLASFLNAHYTRTDSTGQHTATFNDNLLNGILRVNYNYVNKPSVRVYSGAGIGITVDLSNVDAPENVKESERKILFAWQVTFMGIRFGRAFGGFCEFGFGTNSIISAGVNYQFGD